MNTEDHDRPKRQQIYRYRAEIRDLRDGSVRTLPLQVLKIIHLGGKRSDPPPPDEQVLRLQDDSTVIEAKDLDELAAHLRQRYPDETHERLLRRERDLEAEQRRADALESLLQLLADAAVDEILREQGRAPHP